MLLGYFGVWAFFSKENDDVCVHYEKVFERNNLSQQDKN